MNIRTLPSAILAARPARELSPYQSKSVVTFGNDLPTKKRSPGRSKPAVSSKYSTATLAGHQILAFTIEGAGCAKRTIRSCFEGFVEKSGQRSPGLVESRLLTSDN